MADWPVGHLGNARWAGAKIVKMGRYAKLKEKREKEGETLLKKKNILLPIKQKNTFAPQALAHTCISGPF